MTCYSVQPRDQIFVRGHQFFLSCARNIGKNITKNISSKYSHKFLAYAKPSATDALKTASKRAIQKAASSDLIGNKIAD